MKKRPLNKIDLDLYEEELDNGLKIFVIPKNNCNDIYVTFTTKYGSYQNEFVPYKEKEIIKVPEGVAHFLEHKLFDQKDGTDPFTFLEKLGLILMLRHRLIKPNIYLRDQITLKKI